MRVYAHNIALRTVSTSHLVVTIITVVIAVIIIIVTDPKLSPFPLGVMTLMTLRQPSHMRPIPFDEMLY